MLVLLLSACAQVEVKPPAGPVEFDLSGRIAARYRADAFSGLLAWRHAADGDEMLISTPMGQGVARIVRQGDAVVITTSEGREYSDRDGEALTERVLGFRLPLAGLADWVRGRPSPALEERGWKVEYQERDAENRPTRLRVTHSGVDLRLVISEWR
ncbi:MAG TPA: outer membrane lipoprotein LolB [Burkholderiales bacterium]